MGGRVDVVVPAHNEQALLGACLSAVVGDSRGLDVRVIVVANGCDDSTADIARAVGERAASSAGVEVVVVELPAAGKPAALNAANGHLRSVPVVYLDADTVMTPGTLSALLAAMDAAVGPVMAGPRPILVRPGDRLSRGFAAVWSRLPSVRGDVIGGGCYAVNTQGRQRWGAFPDLIADDAYVRSLFTRDERVVVDGGGMLLVLPEGPELSRVLARWRDGNAELGESASPAAGGGRNARAVLAAPALWRHVPAFLWVQGTSRLRRRERWARADGVRAPAPASRPDDLPDDLVVVGSESNAVGELRALAVRFPAAGLYGGPTVRRPALRRAIAFCLGLTTLERHAPVVLVQRALLQRLGGADARFGDHGAVTDLCLRAARQGITPVSIPIRPAWPQPDVVSVLRDEILLHREHLPAWAGRLACRALTLGVRLRALARPTPVWTTAWRHRTEWAGTARRSQPAVR
ncbi:glycosyltransferase [Actinoplanes sp. NEAU-A12]|uniref:Glycosyltransferase n=1 Tax=Actinoplanes sandaracinus TaxID=3045177 RepID=A0ABT6WGI3_9ACTN|nr:glycosyltransferase [Actinoplanes sandaracinus]MDI6098836.1 glycosyltransferase [Actinoplanes sandaracinus]